MEDNKKYPQQQCQDNTITNAFRRLHERLIDEVIGFCRAYNISIDELYFYADSLEDSIKHGSWQSSTDSCLQFNKFTQEYKDYANMKNEESTQKITNYNEYKRIINEQKPFLISM